MTGNKGGNNNEYFSIQIDGKLKSDFAHFCDCTGYTISDAVIMLAKQTIREGKIPFEITSLQLYDEAVGDKVKGSPKSARLTIRMDRDLQKEFSDTCNEIGITRSVLIRMFFMKILNDGRVPL